MKKLVIILILLLLLGGGLGGGAYWWFFMDGASLVLGDAEPEPEPEIPRIYVEMNALTIPVIRGGAVAKYILLQISLEVPDESAREEVIDRMPRLQDAFLRDLHAYFASIPLDSPLNVRTVKQRLQRIADRKVGAGIVDEVLIQGAFEKKN